MKRKAIIWGNTEYAHLIHLYLIEAGIDVEAFCVDESYIHDTVLDGKSVVPYCEFLDKYLPDQYDIYVAIGYNRMNKIREDIMGRLKCDGYNLPNFIHKTASIGMDVDIKGAGNIIMERTIIGAMTVVGNGNIIWPGANVGHNVSIGDYNTLSLNSTVCGFAKIMNSCFLGAGSVIRDKVKIADKTLVGGGTFINKDTNPGCAYVSERAKVLEKNSEEINL